MKLWIVRVEDRERNETFDWAEDNYTKDAEGKQVPIPRLFGSPDQAVGKLREYMLNCVKPVNETLLENDYATFHIIPVTVHIEGALNHYPT